MSEGPQQSPAPDPAPTAAPTTVVGYPGTPVSPSGAPYANPGVAGLRGQVQTVRYLVVACLALLLVLAVGLGVGLVSSRAQISDLSAQVSALTEQVGSVTAAPVTAGEAAPQASAEAVEQLTAAPALDAGTSVPAGVDPTGAILVGDPDAANVVEVYIDYQCPFCQRWEAEVGSALVAKALEPGSDLLVKQYNLAFLGETNATLEPAGASARAASAAACVLDIDGVDVFLPFNASVFRTADPTEPPGQFTAAALTGLATDAGASAEAIACIEAEQNVPFVAATTKAGFARGVGGTPTVVVNGQTVGNPFSDEAVLQLVAGE